MSNKRQKHAYCANAHAPSCVASRLLIPLIEHYQPKIERNVRMIETGDFLSIEGMIAVLNETLSVAEGFAEVPPVNHANQIYKHKSGGNLPYARAYLFLIIVLFL